ncbi:DUF4868 domain-containing protein [Trinickia sp. LjRoot230]|uniref:Kiwa anti-phage protein KwaB-like domain-containing protein n=1 Tax=Trinickia sp. LjRoot230 TaxID=3342288 RepID=UPI003ED01762
MNLFALSRGRDVQILHLPLTAELQQEIAAAFADQLRAFEAGIEVTLEFNGEYVPEEDEALEIRDFRDVDGIMDAIERPMQVRWFDPDRHALEDVKALFFGHQHEGRHAALIQRFEKRRLISRKTLSILFSGDTFQRIRDDGVTLDNQLLAILENGTLKFKSFHFLRRVFDLSEHYREATNAEIEAFAMHDKIAVGNVQDFVASAGPLIRKKIAFIAHSGILEAHTSGQIAQAAQQFGVRIDIDDEDRIVLPTDKPALRKLLKFLDEDYYESPLSKTRFVSSSKRRAD